MILAGCEYDVLDAFGLWKHKKLYKHKDIHEASKDLFAMFHIHHKRYTLAFIRAEYHNTESNRTWSVDVSGHSQRDYRTENEHAFIQRWKDERTKAWS